MSFAPDKSAEDKGRINAVEDYLSLLTERIKFCFNGIDENIAQKSDGKEEKQLIYSTIADEVGQLTATGAGCEIFNDYENNIASSLYAHAEGSGTKATAPGTHAEGNGTVASSSYAHAEGRETTASGESSHAEGENTTASGYNSHSEGNGTAASGGYSHAEGYGTTASGWYSHAGGINSEAKAEASFAHGENVVSNYRGGAAFGIGNKTKDALFVVGNGSPQGSYESDALVLDNAGNLWVAGKLTAENQNTLYGLAIEAHGAVRFGNNWASDNANILLAVGNGYDSERLRDALTLDSDGNLTVSGKYSSAKGYDFSNAIASDTALGAIKVGENLSISEDGTLSASGGNSYVLPSATADTLGGVMIGNNILVTADGVISVNLSEYLKSDAISDWAKAKSKPAYTAEEVGAATAADITAAVNAVEIGGRNLLYDSTGNLKKGWNANVTITENGGISGNSLAISRSGYSGNARYFGVSKRWFLADFKVGTSYTLSAWIKVRSDVELDSSGYVMARFRSADNTKLHILPLTVNSKTKKDEWLYYEKTWTIDDSDIAKLECVALALDKNGMIEVCDIKLEKGNKATDWSPAVEEDTERIASLEARVAALEAMAVSGGEV